MEQVTEEREFYIITKESVLCFRQDQVNGKTKRPIIKSQGDLFELENHIDKKRLKRHQGTHQFN